MASVLNRFSTVLVELDRFCSSFVPNRNTDEQSRPLLEATDHLLDAVFEHTEDCKNIIASFFPSKDDLRAERVLREFKKSVEPYRDHIGRVVNFIKHRQGRLRIIVFSGPAFCYPGYLVEGIVEDGVLGAAPIVHGSPNTAFSFNRDLRLHIVGLYLLGAHLAQAIYDATKLPPARANSSAEDSRRLQDVLDGVSRLSMVFFPDELTKSVPLVKERSDSVDIEIGGDSARAEKMPPARVQVTYHGDGVTGSFKAPYIL